MNPTAKAAEKPISVGGVKFEDRTGLAKGGVIRNMDDQQEAALELLAREVAAKDPRAKLKKPDGKLVYEDMTPLVDESKDTLLKLFGWTETDPKDPFDSPQMNPAKFSDQPGAAAPAATPAPAGNRRTDIAGFALNPDQQRFVNGEIKFGETPLGKMFGAKAPSAQLDAARQAMQLIADDKPQEAEKLIKAAGFKDFDELEAFLKGKR
jgi:hypothetical protein